ncbi:uncharacterized protein SAPINGB_P003138 [Magnusiomyces paraingens]|uniref:Uncharacterized protein n=1 Tax=Magnusiomyces paraingens TaxID=2606893 RepID=A0A5E8BIS1_9ASCO|nr:uncharacterized protein SAPINGB_P003138 [Saprochaete ingens]VVT51564.1 unnamed protein product [Saprochaete ingens]
MTPVAKPSKTQETQQKEDLQVLKQMHTMMAKVETIVKSIHDDIATAIENHETMLSDTHRLDKIISTVSTS